MVVNEGRGAIGRRDARGALNLPVYTYISCLLYVYYSCIPGNWKINIYFEVLLIEVIYAPEYTCIYILSVSYNTGTT